MKTFERLAKKHTAGELLDMIEVRRLYMEGATGSRYAAFRRRWLTLQRALSLKLPVAVSASEGK
ncbi:hypothetical protein [Duganella vulcania]|uniref:Uncharacterized protein n=1 Tax=Duganella vulcania TaxID=2692166 RepID=A0A845GDQ1_9BURK|nr:hypothetical protein [Duganella vulcania]MYM92404.1 hypothetical protein [Duganella vulcania]